MVNDNEQRPLGVKGVFGLLRSLGVFGFRSVCSSNSSSSSDLQSTDVSSSFDTSTSEENVNSSACIVSSKGQSKSLLNLYEDLSDEYKERFWFSKLGDTHSYDWCIREEREEEDGRWKLILPFDVFCLHLQLAFAACISSLRFQLHLQLAFAIAFTIAFVIAFAIAFVACICSLHLQLHLQLHL
ncbi:hypothetical protein Tco_1221335 [Tanacetum coccineum]